MEVSLADGHWAEARKLKKGRCSKQGRLRDAIGTLVESDRRAESLEEHVAKAQRAVRPITLLDDDAPVNLEFPMHFGPITFAEITTAAKELQNGKAPGMEKRAHSFGSQL